MAQYAPPPFGFHLPQDPYQTQWAHSAPAYPYSQPQWPQHHPVQQPAARSSRAPQACDASGARRPYDGGMTPVAASTESARPSRSTQVCLDWLKGICTTKRAKCRYAHPPHRFGTLAQEMAEQQDPDGPKLCEVFVLTGFCKFGEQCRDYHPNQAFNPVCAPPTSSKMTTECRDAAEAAAVAAWDCESDVDEDEAAGFSSLPDILSTVRKLLETATLGDFDASPSIVERVCSVISDGQPSGDCLQQVLPTLYSVGVNGGEKAAVVARLCSYLFNLVPAAARNTLRTSLVNYCGKLVYHVEDLLSVFDGEQEARTLERKRLGNAAFIGHLFVLGVISQQFLEQVIETLLQRCVRVDVEGGFQARLLCTLMDTCGANLKEIRPQFLTTKMHKLSALARRHGPEVVDVVRRTVEELQK